MSNLNAVLAGIKRVAVNGVLLSVGSPPSIVLNLTTGLNAVLNAVTGYYDVTAAGGGGGSSTGSITSVQTVYGAGIIQAVAGAMVFVDASAGPCIVYPPALVAGTPQCWGISDVKVGTFSLTNYAQVPNAGSTLEHPLVIGNYGFNPVTLTSPSMTVVWYQDPTGTYWKAA
jgi:hypothetical protein